jgi:hypothetical protein
MLYTETQLAAARDQHEVWLNQQEGITGTGIGMDRGGQICIKIYTNRMSAATKSAVLARLQGLPVEFEETGEFQAL